MLKVAIKIPEAGAVLTPLSNARTYQSRRRSTNRSTTAVTAASLAGAMPYVQQRSRQLRNEISNENCPYFVLIRTAASIQVVVITSNLKLKFKITDVLLF